MAVKTALCLILVMFWVLPICASSKKMDRLRNNPLSKTRCDLVCYDVSKDDKAQCRSKCRSQEQKPGTCPIQDTPKWAAACVESCNADNQCDGTQRCCRHGCGSTCDEPVDILSLSGLPALPVIEEVKEKRRSAVAIKWSDGVGDAAREVPGRILYVLEEQHHLGPKYEETKLGNWNVILRTNKTKASLRKLIKPGRWYRFRVAAVNASGTRGFSTPSATFTARKGPRPPPPPRKLRVTPLQKENNTVTVRLDWREPRSDLPVLRYKVFWSRRVRGLGGELDSVLVNHQAVSKDQNHLDIKGLQPDSMYFIQVQTISQFGLSKLRSEKTAIFYNTTNGKIHDNAPELLQKRDKKIKNLKLIKIVWYNNKITAKISWEPIDRVVDEPRRYFIRWKSTKCAKSQQKNKEFLAVTEQNAFEIYELDYDCSYKVKINGSRKSKLIDSELFIVVPSCEYFQKRLTNKFNCSV